MKKKKKKKKEKKNSLRDLFETFDALIFFLYFYMFMHANICFCFYFYFRNIQANAPEIRPFDDAIVLLRDHSESTTVSVIRFRFSFALFIYFFMCMQCSCLIYLQEILYNKKLFVKGVTFYLTEIFVILGHSHGRTIR